MGQSVTGSGDEIVEDVVVDEGQLAVAAFEAELGPIRVDGGIGAEIDGDESVGGGLGSFGEGPLAVLVEVFDLGMVAGLDLEDAADQVSGGELVEPAPGEFRVIEADVPQNVLPGGFLDNGHGLRICWGTSAVATRVQSESPDTVLVTTFCQVKG